MPAPSSTRRSWWLREALALEGADLSSESVAAPLGGETRADIAIVGGGYTGLWTALRLTELAPGARVVLLEADICGGGPSGRNGGFATAWWDELPTLLELYGETDGLAVARAMADAVDEIGRWSEANGVDAWYRRAGSISVSAAPPQDGAWAEAVEACERLGLASAYASLSAEEVALRVRSPVFRAGAFMADGATIQPARLARGLRRVAIERGVTIHEGTRVVRQPRPGGRRGSEGPVRLETSSARGDGVVVADQVVLGLNAWAAAWPAFGSRLVTWSSYIVITEPIPDRLAEIGWTGGEGVADARFTLHYARTTPDGRIVLGGGGGRAGFGGRIGPPFTDDLTSARRAAVGLWRWFPSLRDVRLEDAWGGPIDITADHLPYVGTLPGGRVHFGHGYSGNGVAPSVVIGRSLAALAAGVREDPWLGLPIIGHRPGRFPPEPARYIGARIAREAIVRREQAEERGRRVGPVTRFLSTLPRRMGYHLGPE